MQKELQEAGDAGFEYRDQTVFKTAFGGDEVIVILERDRETPRKRYEYKLLATNRTQARRVVPSRKAGLNFMEPPTCSLSLAGSPPNLDELRSSRSNFN
jgi:hypothetical protein